MSDTVGDLCLFRCPSCKRKFVSWKDMVKHRREKGCLRCSVSQSGVVLKCTKIKCALCGAVEFCDTDIFRTHLLSVHAFYSLKR